MGTKWNPVNEPPGVHEDWMHGTLISDYVLVYRRAGRMCCAYYQIWVDGEEYEATWITADSEGWDITNEVTHWMPLPESPKEIQK